MTVSAPTPSPLVSAPPSSLRPSRRQRARRALRRAVAAGRDDSGMTTAEYAVGTVAACGFAGVLWKVVTSDRVSTLLAGVVERALTTGF